MTVTYLKAADETSMFAALEAAGIANVQWLGRGDVVTDPILIAALDQQPVDADLSCEYEGQHYAARDGAWLVLLPVAVAAPGVFLDVIGPVSLPTGEIDEEGNKIMAPIDGYHANIYTPVTDEQKALLPWIDPPANPVRVKA